MRHCDFCEAETIPGATLMAAGGVVPVCTKCGKAYRGAPEEIRQTPQPAAPAKIIELRPTTLAGASADSIIEAARTRLAVVDAEIARLKSLVAERRMLARIVRTKDKP